MNKYLGIVGLVVVLVLGVVFPRGNKVVQQVLSGSGQDSFAHTYLRNGYTVGGSFATSSAGSFTLQTKEIIEANTYTLTPGAALTMTMPASSTMNFLPEKGMTRTMFVKNGASTAGRDITIAQSTGVILRGVNGTSTIIYAGRGAQLIFYRSATSTPLGDVYVTVIPE